MNKNTVVDLVAVGVNLLAQKKIIQKPDEFSELLSTMFGGESYERRIAKDVVNTGAQVVSAISRVRTNRAFKKIVEKV